MNTVKRLVIWGAAGIAAAIALGPIPAAEAGTTRICADLKMRFAALQNAPAGAVRRFDAAIARQKDQMAVTRSQARDARCGFAFLGADIRRCAAYNATLSRMADNLDQLQSERTRLSGNDSRRESAHLQAAIERNNCQGRDPDTEASDATISAPRRVAEAQPLDDALSRILTAIPPDEANGPGETPQDRIDGEDLRDDMNAGADSQIREGTYRTMCVRTCDGYFFPMSQAVAASDFERDEKGCETACPGTDVQLFYGKPGSVDAATMISTSTGRPYSEMPAAFRHQQVSTQPDAACSCHPAKGFTISAGAGSNQATAPTGQPLRSVAVVQPSPSVLVMQDDGAAAPPMTHFEEHDRDRSIRSLAGQRSADRKIRVVGPAFLPDPEEAAGLKAQDPVEVR